jgi:predicted transcriptional regulator
MKTMAIRLEDDLHAQLSVIASLEEQTITDVIRASILAYIGARKDALSGKAEAALEEIDRDAESRRQAIAALFGTSSGTTTKDAGPDSQPTGLPPAAHRTPRGQKGGSEG